VSHPLQQYVCLPCTQLLQCIIFSGLVWLMRIGWCRMNPLSTIRSPCDIFLWLMGRSCRGKLASHPCVPGSYHPPLMVVVYDCVLVDVIRHTTRSNFFHRIHTPQLIRPGALFLRVNHLCFHSYYLPRSYINTYRFLYVYKGIC
jgi:hypothetical protein